MFLLKKLSLLFIWLNTTKMSAMKSKCRRVMGRLVNNELEGTWKEVVVA